MHELISQVLRICLEMRRTAAKAGKGRGAPRGSEQKLTIPMAIYMRRTYQVFGPTRLGLAFGVSLKTAEKIARGKAHTYLDAYVRPWR